MADLLRYECDKIMAEKKGMLGVCDKDCKVCFCCFEIDNEGQKSHVDVRRNRELRMRRQMGDLYNENFSY